VRYLKRSLILCALGAAAVAVAAVQSGTEPPANPHLFLENEDLCVSCHTYFEGQLEPHMFSVMVHEKCIVCHTKLGRSHPINVNPQDSYLRISDTDPLPLAYIEELGDDVVSCGSCHNPHGEWLSTAKAYMKQQPYFILVSSEAETLYYKTYYLRISDPVKGFMPLCQVCHNDF
jgi:hypothetical protein